MVEQQTRLIEQQTTLVQQQMTAQAHSTEQQHRVPYEAFKKLGPPSFSGIVDPIEAENWIADMEKIFSVMEVTDTQQVVLATFMLTGDARYWWEATQRRLDPAPTADVTWPQFTQVFFDKYFPISYRRQRRGNF
jgi:hypothetical protein